MVVDASAVIAILFDEDDGPDIRRRLIAAQARLMVPMNVMEAHMILRSRRGDSGVVQLDNFLAATSIEIVATDAAQLAAARAAFDRYGKGRHPAGLNIADCFAYALARTSGEPLLFKGRDFALTDVLVA